MAKEKKAVVKYYRLRRPFFNGSVHCEAGTVQPFPEGNQPKGAVEVTAAEMKAEAVMQETSQDVYIASEVAKYVDQVLPELVEAAVEAALPELVEVAVEAALAELEAAVPPTPPSGPSAPTK